MLLSLLFPSRAPRVRPPRRLGAATTTAAALGLLIAVGPAPAFSRDPATAAPANAARYYVDAAHGASAGDGRSWATAFATIQPALDAAAAHGGGEVWVAAGTYRPTAGGDRTATFQLRPGVALYGGFTGQETHRDQRDWRQHRTLLSGDIGEPGVATDNSYHVVTGADDAVLDGFTITAGYALDARDRAPRSGPPLVGPRPGGRPGPAGPAGPAGTGPIHTTPEALLRGPQPGTGAGLLNYQCAPTVRHCLFVGNRAAKGAAMYNLARRRFPPARDAEPPPAVPEVIACEFRDNHAEARGGAVANDLGTSPVFRDCLFAGNTCDGKGGALYNDFACSPALAGCLFTANRARSGGAIANDGGSSPHIVHCTFTANVAQEEGAALYQGTGPDNHPTVVGCILWDNRCTRGPAEIYNWHDNTPTVTGSCVQGGYPGAGNLDVDPRFAQPAAGDFTPEPGSPCASLGHTAPIPAAWRAELAARPRTDFAGGPPRPPGPRAGAGAPPPAAATTAAPTTAAPRTTTTAAPPILWRVHAASTAASPDGASWATAYRSLRAALAAAATTAATGQPVELWVAAGTYRPDDAGADRAASFALATGVALYGGFAGHETSRAQRDWRAHPTVLSGDLGRSGEPSDNAYHVVLGADGAVLDGFVISDGQADGPTYDGKGGGLINYRRGPQAGPMRAPTGCSTVVRHCVFRHNHAREGGAVYNYDRGAPEFSDCRFEGNTADYGGAMVDRVGVRSVLTQVIFEDNQAKWRGGALYLDYGARPRLVDCTFAANRCDVDGGALATVSRASQLEATIATLQSCTFTANEARQSGGAIANHDRSLLGLDSCRLAHNRAGTGGGALANTDRARIVLVACTLEDNRAASGADEIASDGTATLSRRREDWPDPTATTPAGGPPPRPDR